MKRCATLLTWGQRVRACTTAGTAARVATIVQGRWMGQQAAAAAPTADEAEHLIKSRSRQGRRDTLTMTVAKRPLINTAPAQTEETTLMAAHPLTLDVVCERLAEDRFAGLREKLVLHRGWHSLNATHSRPLENTREAYLLAAKTQARYAECDCWDTSDGEIVLCHNSTFQSLAEDPESSPAKSPIKEQTWEQVKNIQLKDGSTPVLLSTVLRDLEGTSTRLAIELKSERPAGPLAVYLNRNPEIVSSVGFVMSFSAAAVQTFLANINPNFGIQVNWLVDCKDGYPPDYLDEGETTFHVESRDLAPFLRESGNYEMMRQSRVGLYIQYNTGITAAILTKLRRDLADMQGVDPSEVFLGVWSDMKLDPGFDSASSLTSWMPFFDALNTDLPDAFFETQ